MTSHLPRFGIQGPVVAWSDPWAPEASEAIMRTGTGVPIASQDAAPSPAQFAAALRELGADFYVHHVVPGHEGGDALLADLAAASLDVVLGNEYGNVNGPHVPGTNRYDVPDAVLARAQASGRLAGVLYDEPEHLQIHADQYRKDAFLPHVGQTAGQDADAAIATITATVRDLVARTDAPVLAEQVFPVMFHVLARAGMTPTPKVMKEAFQPLQLSTALGAAVQYGRGLWICADLWGPDVGPWFTRAPGFPGHSPAEFASALRMAYLFAPAALFVENVDALLRHDGGGSFARTEFGAVWEEFVRDFVPRHPLTWRFDEATADIAIVAADDSDFGRGHQPFGARDRTAPETARSLFQAWHALSGGSIPSHGSCQHIDGFDFPRHRLNGIPRAEFPLAEAAPEQTRTHGLFHRSRNVLVFDEHVGEGMLRDAGLVLAVGSRLPAATVAMLRRRADAGATVVIASWLAGEDVGTTRTGDGLWIVVDALDDDAAVEAVEEHSGGEDLWTQRFGGTEVRFAPGDAHGETLSFEIAGSG